MEVYFTPEEEAKLEEMAAIAGSSTHTFVKEAALRVIAEDSHFAEMVQAGEAQLDRGEFLSHAEVGKRLSRFLGR